MMLFPSHRPTLREKILTATSIEELDGMREACEGRDEPFSAAERNAYEIRKKQLGGQANDDS